MILYFDKFEVSDIASMINESFDMHRYSCMYALIYCLNDISHKMSEYDLFEIDFSEHKFSILRDQIDSSDYDLPF